MDNNSKKKSNAVEWAMRHRQIVILVTCCLVAFGIYSLPEMRKNEFPDFTIRQGIVVAVAPGNTAEEMLEQVTKPLEEYIFTYKEVRKEKTFSKSRDGIVYIQVQLNDELYNKDEFWSKFKHGVSEFKAQLPSNVLAVQVMDDFGDTSALLITMESEDKTYRELRDYLDRLQDRLRRIPSVGRMTVSGLRREQISVYVNPDRLSQYGLNEQGLALSLMRKGFVTSGGRIKTGDHIQPVYVSRSLNTVYDVQQQIVYADPAGNIVRLKDIARVAKEYPEADSYITNNGRKCLLLSVEMKKGQNIVQMGSAIDEVMNDFSRELPQDVSIFRITDQSQVVGDSVSTFLRELLIAIVAVVIVVMLLLPMRVALVAASTIPLTIFISLGLFHACEIELNTVTLAALIVTLGMIVDNSIVIIDSYLERLGEGVPRWEASIESTLHFFKSIFSATLAISVTFFPFLITTTGMINDFLRSFPWAITIVLGVSLLTATLLVPFMQYWFIRKPMQQKTDESGKEKFSFLNLLQRHYDQLLNACLTHPKATVGIGLLSVAAGALLMGRLPQQIMPYADRNQFAVEIFLPTGTDVKQAAAVADSLEHILRRDPRVVSVASFKGCASPRFQNSYAPQIAGTNFAQFIVNTTGIQETVELLDEYAPRYVDYFPEARVRFKQLSYSEAVYPIEVRLSGDDPEALKHDAERVRTLLQEMPELVSVQTDLNEPLAASEVTLREDEATRLGLTNLDVETTLAMRYGAGISLFEVWEGDYAIPVVLKSERANQALLTDLKDEQMPVASGLFHVPLRQAADVHPTWKDRQIVRRNGARTLTIMADLERGENAMTATARVQEKLAGLPLSPGVSLTYGGEHEDSEEKMTPVMSGLFIAAAIIFFILMFHFRKVSIAALVFASMALCLFGTAAGILIQGVNFSVTCVLGIVSLMGIIVRNGIIMVDYAEELRTGEGIAVPDAIHHSAQRRMRPIFLTSAAASMGVIPMILGRSGLWMPMGTVICYGTLITMVFLLTVLPCAYLLLFRERQGKPGWSGRRAGILALLITIGATSTPASAQRAYTLDECISEALRNNIHVRNADNDLSAARHGQQEALTRYFPTIGATGGGFMANRGIIAMEMAPGESMSLLKNGVAGGITATLPLFTGGRIVNADRLAGVNVEVSHLQRRQAEDEVRLTTEQYFWQVVVLKEKLRTLSALEAQLDGLYKDTEAAVDAGIARRNDLLQVRLRRNELRSRHLRAESDLSVARNLLAQYIGHYPDSVDAAPISTDSLPERPDPLHVQPESALPLTAGYGLLQENVKAARLQHRLSVGKFLPAVSVGSGWLHDNLTDRNRPVWMGFATVSVPLSGWWGGSHELKRQRLQMRNAENRLTDQAQLLVIHMQSAWNDLTDAYKQTEIAMESIGQASENLRLQTDYYHAGTCTMSDLLEAQALYHQSRDQYMEAYAGYALKKREYLQATGR